MQVAKNSGTILGGPGGASSLSIPTTFTRLSLSSAVANADPTTRLSSAITDGGEGTGISFPLTGGWTSTDWTGAYPYIVWNLSDVLGAAVGSETQFSFNMLCKIRTGPGDSTDTVVRFGIVNESDLTTATIDGFTAGINFGSAIRTISTSTATNGVGAAVVAGTGSATITQGTFGFTRIGTGATSSLRPSAAGLDSSNVFVASSQPNSSILSILGNGSQYYIVLCAGRSATTAGSVTVAVDLYLQPIIKSALPTV